MYNLKKKENRGEKKRNVIKHSLNIVINQSDIYLSSTKETGELEREKQRQTCRVHTLFCKVWYYLIGNLVLGHSNK